MITVPDPKDLVAKIRKAQADRGLSINDIIKLMKERGYFPCGQATISRLLSGDKEESNYDYLNTILPIYNTLFIDEKENNEEKFLAMQELLEYKLECIESLKAQIDALEEAHKEDIARLKDKYRAKIDKETERFQEIMEFRGKQIELKDERITQLLDGYTKLTEHILNCPYKGKC